LRLKPVRVGDNLTDKGRFFQTMGPETEKALSLSKYPVWFLFVAIGLHRLDFQLNRAVSVYCRHKEQLLFIAAFQLPNNELYNAIRYSVGGSLFSTDSQCRRVDGRITTSPTVPTSGRTVVRTRPTRPSWVLMEHIWRWDVQDWIMSRWDSLWLRHSAQMKGSNSSTCCHIGDDGRLADVLRPAFPAPYYDYLYHKWFDGLFGGAIYWYLKHNQFLTNKMSPWL